MSSQSTGSFTPRRLLTLSSILALLPFLTGCAIRSTKDHPSSLALFWTASSVLIKGLLIVGSLALLVWIIGGLVLGYLIFAINSNALTAVRWGYFIGGLFWLFFALAFLWLALLVKPLILLGVLIGGVLLVAILVFGIFKAPRIA